MKLKYTVTEEIYEEAIVYQMRLHDYDRGRLIRSWLMNVAFLGVAVYYLVSRSALSLPRRLAPLGMSLVLLGVAVWRLAGRRTRAHLALKRYIRQGVLEEGFLGEHTLLVERGKLRRQAGKSWREVDASSFGMLLDHGVACLLIAGGVIFDTIPKAVLEEGDTKERLLEAIEHERSDRSDQKYTGSEDGEGASGL